MNIIVHRYFTLWTWIFFFFFPSHPMNMVNSAISSTGGFYLTYVYPRFLKAPVSFIDENETVTIDGYPLWIVDMITHHSLFLYQLYRYAGRYRYPWTTVLRWHGLFFLYFVTCFDPDNYSLRWSDVYCIAMLYIVVWMLGLRWFL